MVPTAAHESQRLCIRTEDGIKCLMVTFQMGGIRNVKVFRSSQTGDREEQQRRAPPPLPDQHPSEAGRPCSIAAT